VTFGTGAGAADATDVAGETANIAPAQAKIGIAHTTKRRRAFTAASSLPRAGRPPHYQERL
jgi:hypothetical protein